MPWHTSKVGNKYVVRKGRSGMGGKIVGTHDSKAGAQAQMKALYANVPDAKKPQTG